MSECPTGDDRSSADIARVSRRELLRQAAGVGMLAASGTMIEAIANAGAAAAANGPHFSIPKGPNIYSKVLPKLPKGGDLTLSLPTIVPPNLDPTSTSIVATKIASYPAHDFLEYYDERGQRVLSLAESMRVRSSTVIEYRLQPNVRFHNGERVTSQSIADLFAWLTKPGNAPGIATLVAGVQVQPVDARTFRFVLPAPNAAFRDALANVPIMPVSAAGQQASSPVGCGPFVFKEWVRDVSVSYAKNPSYWNKEAPPVSSLKLLTFADVQAGVQAFSSRSSDFVYAIPPAQLPGFRTQASQKAVKLSSQLGQYYYLRPNATVKPYDDPNVRQAIRLCIDRNAVNNAAEAGNGVIVYQPVVPGHAYFSKEFAYKRDVPRAKALMAAAGYSNGVNGGNMLVPILANAPAAAQVIQANLSEIGINVQLQTVDLATYATLRFRTPLLCSVAFYANEIATLFNGWFLSNGTSNFTHFANPRVDYLLLSAVHNYNDAARRKLYLEAFRELFVKQVGMIAIVGIEGTNAFRTNTNGSQYEQTNGQFFRYPITSIGKA